MAEVRITLDGAGGTYLSLAPSSGAEIRDSVALDELDQAQTVSALDGIVLDFDFYGRLAGIQVTGAADSILPPALLEQAEHGA